MRCGACPTGIIGRESNRINTVFFQNEGDPYRSKKQAIRHFHAENRTAPIKKALQGLGTYAVKRKSLCFIDAMRFALILKKNYKEFLFKNFLKTKIKEDTTIGNDNSKIKAPLNVLANSSRDNLIKNKPPLPMQSVYNTIFKQNKIKSQQRNGNPMSSQSNYNDNENENDENCDETVASVKLNESDLNQLDKDYNFEFSEEDDDDDDDNSEEEKKQTSIPNPIKCQEQTPRNASSTKEPLTHLKMNNNEFKIISKQNAEFLQKFDILEATQDENENISNESVNILRISDSKLDLESDTKQFNYGSFDKVNDSSNQSVFKLPDSPCERVNQIVRQSMERTARSAMEKSEILLKNDHLNLSASSCDTNNLQAKNERSTVGIEDSSNESQLANQTSSNLMPYANSRVLGSIYYKPWPVVDTTSVFKQQNDENLNESGLRLDSSLFNIPKDFNKLDNHNIQDEVKNAVVSSFPFDRPLDDEEYRNNLFASSKNANEKRLTTSKHVHLVYI